MPTRAKILPINRIIASMTTQAAVGYAAIAGLLVFATTIGFLSYRESPEWSSSIGFRSFIGLILSMLFSLLIFQLLVNAIRTRELDRKTKQLKTLFQNLPGAAYRILIDIENKTEQRVEFLSEGFLALTGYQIADMLSGQLTFISLVHRDDTASVINNVNQAIASNRMYDFECRLRQKSGNYIWLWQRGRAVERGKNGLVYIEGFVSDVTSRKRAEIALLEARSFAEAIVDTAIEGIVLIDSEGMIKNFNSSAESMFGYQFAEVKGLNVGILMPDNIRREHDHYIKRYLETNQATIIGTGREMLAKRKNGELFPVDLSISEVFHQKNRTFVGLIRDISKQRAAEDEARLHRDQLAHVGRLNALGEMASGIAHEINQPLAAISLFAQAGKRFLQTGNVEKTSEAFDKLSQHAQRAGAIIERIQGMVKQYESEKRLTHCLDLLAEVAELAESEARIHDIEIVIEVAPSLPPVLVDMVQIQQVALNLIRNGMQAMQAVQCKHGNVIKMIARMTEQANIEIAIVDSGNGVSKLAEARLFEPFSSTKEYGMGMGLSISRAIVEAHGGHLYFQNNRDFGATFFFSLPGVGKSDADKLGN